MPLNEQQREEKDDTLKNSTMYWVFFGIGATLFILLAWRGLMKVNIRMIQMRNNFWPFMKRVLLAGIILIIVVAIVVAAINIRGKVDQREQHQQDDTE